MGGFHTTKKEKKSEVFTQFSSHKFIQILSNKWVAFARFLSDKLEAFTYLDIGSWLFDSCCPVL